MRNILNLAAIAVLAVAVATPAFANPGVSSETPADPSAASSTETPAAAPIAAPGAETPSTDVTTSAPVQQETGAAASGQAKLDKKYSKKHNRKKKSAEPAETETTAEPAK